MREASGLDLAGVIQEIQPLHRTHVLVRDDDAELFLLEVFQCGARVLESGYLAALFQHGQPQQIEHARIVIDE